jgi:methionyl-tRNA synthetase
MTDKTPFYITTAIAYVNGSPHLGHAYEAILTDVMARFKRLDGYDVMFLTGTDEHGQKVAATAQKNGMNPKEFCDKIAAEFEALDQALNISHDDFIRTTEPRHYAASQALWKKLEANGDIYLSKYDGWYSIREEAFFDEKELKIDPITGQKRSPNDTEVQWVEESSYFFRLSNYTEKLLAYFEAHPDFIAPVSRRNEIVSFVKQGLRDLSISRTNFTWGVPVPDQPDHVMYVWLDALTNYITALGYPDENSEQFKKFWATAIHVIGKDITRFHTIYWVAFLMAAKLEIPKQVFAHGFINVEGEKMSKSLGNVVSPYDLIRDFGVDATRFLLMREISHGEDGNFSHDHAVAKINADLANGLGNLAQRTLSFIYKNAEAMIPQAGNLTAEDKELLKSAQVDLLPAMRREFEAFHIHRALEAVWRVVNAANVYIDAQAPWTLKKTDPARMNTVLYVLAEVIRCLALAVQPVMPEASGKLLDQVTVGAGERDFTFLSAAHTVKAGTVIPQPVGVFPRIVTEETQKKSA